MPNAVASESRTPCGHWVVSWTVSASPCQDCNGGKQADRIVRIRGSAVGLLDLHVGGGNGAGHVSAHMIGRPWMGHPRGSGVVVGENRSVTLVRDLDQRGRRLRLLSCLSHD